MAAISRQHTDMGSSLHRRQQHARQESWSEDMRIGIAAWQRAAAKLAIALPAAAGMQARGARCCQNFGPATAPDRRRTAITIPEQIYYGLISALRLLF